MSKFNDGVYLFEIRKWSWGKSQGGTPSFDLQGFPVGAPKDPFDLDKGFEEIPEGERRARTVTEYLTPKTAGMFRDKLIESDLGWDGHDINQLDPDHSAAIDLTGKTILVQCSNEVYKGKPREKWQITRKMARRVLSKDDKKDLASKYSRIFEEVAAEKAKAQKDPSSFEYGANKKKARA